MFAFNCELSSNHSYADPGDDMEIVTWNVARRQASLLDAMARNCRPDIVTLQEVGLEQIDAYRERLAVLGLKYLLHSGRNDLPAKRYGNIIASSLPLMPVDLRGLEEDLPWPQAIAEAEIRVNGLWAVVITTQVPNGSNNGWERSIPSRCSRSVFGPPTTNRVFSPAISMNPGLIFKTRGSSPGGRRETGKAVSRAGTSGRSVGVPGTGEEWDAAVRWFFENSTEHGLRHAYWEACGQGATAVSHVSGGSPRWFDHIFVSRDFRVVRCSYLQDLRGREVSDHSALLAKVELAA